jgi:hypothetical protein
MVAADKFDISVVEDIIEEINFDNQNDFVQPMPHKGLSFVFYIGNATVYEYYESETISITVRPFSNRIKWFCIGRPFGPGSAGGGNVISLHDIKGYIGPKPIFENGSINFIFGLVKDIVIMIP